MFPFKLLHLSQILLHSCTAGFQSRTTKATTAQISTYFCSIFWVHTISWSRKICMVVWALFLEEENCIHFLRPSQTKVVPRNTEWSLLKYLSLGSVGIRLSSDEISKQLWSHTFNRFFHAYDFCDIQL